MTNKYMFFNAQQFDNFDLSEYEKNDISIPKTNIHIYEFKCKNTEETSDDESKAKKLDELTQKLEKDFADQFITVNSGSSQLFCSKLYPLIVEFETNLRYALYISRALFENGNVDKKSFKLSDGKNIEEEDFGQMYQYIFTDNSFQKKIKALLGKEPMTKSDYIKEIQSYDENIMWQKWVGKDYNYIELNFLAIKDYRNDVMHNHLINFDTYKKAKETISKALDTLNRAINDKLIVNESKYLNTNNILDALCFSLLNMGAYFQNNEIHKLLEGNALATAIPTLGNLTPNQSSIMNAAKIITDTLIKPDNIQNLYQANNLTDATLQENETSDLNSSNEKQQKNLEFNNSEDQTNA